MSAWIVSKEHIDALVQAALIPTPHARDGIIADPDDAHVVGRMLWSECHRSVRSRYPGDADGALPGPTGLTWAEITAYTYTPPSAPLPPVVVLKNLDCYEYQSCEHDGWTASEARKFCDRLRDHVIKLLPGYEAAPWGID